MPMLTEPDWPCEDRRDAHGRHRTKPQKPTDPDEPWTYICPGVPAHPLTMAGGAWRDPFCPDHGTQPTTYDRCSCELRASG